MYRFPVLVWAMEAATDTGWPENMKATGRSLSLFGHHIWSHMKHCVTGVGRVLHFHMTDIDQGLTGERKEPTGRFPLLSLLLWIIPKHSAIIQPVQRHPTWMNEWPVMSLGETGQPHNALSEFTPPSPTQFHFPLICSSSIVSDCFLLNLG